MTHDAGSGTATEHIVITGNVRGTGTFAVEGRVVGNVEVDTLIIAAGGTVQGNLNAATVEVRGKVTGNIAAKSIRLTPSSEVRGDLSYQQIEVQSGASFEGRCTPER